MTYITHPVGSVIVIQCTIFTLTQKLYLFSLVGVLQQGDNQTLPKLWSFRVDVRRCF